MSGYTLGQPYGHGRTYQHTDIVPAPDPGAGATVTVGRAPYSRLIYVSLSLTTSSATADRLVTIEYPGSDNQSVLADGASVLVEASTTAQRFIGSIYRGPAEWNTGTPVWFPLSGIWLEEGRTIEVNVNGIDTDDQLSAIYLTFDRLVTPYSGADPYEDQRAELETGG